LSTMGETCKEGVAGKGMGEPLKLLPV